MTKREFLPAKRSSQQFKKQVGRKTVFATVGYYSDGRPGELFLDVGREGEELRSLLASVGQSISLALQHGCPAETLIEVLKSNDKQHYNNIVAEILAEAVTPFNQEEHVSTVVECEPSENVRRTWE